MRQSRVVVTHGGVGSMLDAIKASRPVIVIPRMAIPSEVVNDHQVELATALAQRNLITLVYDPESLERALNLPSLPIGRISPPTDLIRALRESIERLG
jgi:UDP-N-acetylglucosamine transferase subunit ALG13